MTTRPNEKQCVEMWEKSTSPAEYEAMYDKFMEDRKGIIDSEAKVLPIITRRMRTPSGNPLVYGY